MPDSSLTVNYLPASDRNLEFERDLLLVSGIFDAAAYLEAAGPQAREDPVGHYLQKGWLGGLDPNPDFPGSLFQPYFAAIGSREPPAITWLTLRSAGWLLPGTHREVVYLVSILRDSGYFDEPFYANQAGKIPACLDPYIHYLAVGERLGFKPSPGFDPVYYRQRYPDIAQAGVSPLVHFLNHGRHEGRSGNSTEKFRKGRAQADPNKSNILLVIHEASRTGAPILGWNIALRLGQHYNIYVISFGGGDLMAEFEALSVEIHTPQNRYEMDVDYSLRGLLNETRFRYAIVNSIESRDVLESCVRRIIPTVLLMHEFGAYVYPAAALRTALDWSTEVVFPSRIVSRSATEVHPPLLLRQVHILPQGLPTLPQIVDSQQQESSPVLEELAKRREVEGVLVVLGAGSVQIRKGVDLFLSTAAAIKRSQPQAKIVLLWVGNGFLPERDMGYSVYLKEQISRGDLDSHVIFHPEVNDLDPVYRIADLFFLSSRLDPMPNVAIEAAMRGIPIICFKEASGTSELLLSDPEAARGVVDHLDTEAAARLILELSRDGASRSGMSDATKRLAQRTFDMRSYIANLDALGLAAAERLERRAADAKTLLDDFAFDQHLFLGSAPIIESRKETVARYLAISAARGWRDEVSSKAIRRPAPGFNPSIYAALREELLPVGADPLAHFIQSGKPAGPWQTPVLRPEELPAHFHPSGKLRVAIHAHLFHAELAGDFLAHLEPNQTPCDLLVSTDTSSKADRLRRTLAAYRLGKVDVRVVPNKGRDIGALLTGFAVDLAEYDLIGHVHSKRSLLAGDPSVGESWREFLWQHLLGGSYPMLDRIAVAFEEQETLGLVFPSDGHLVGWDANRDIAGELAARIGWKGALPDAFDFPLGAMFYIRRPAFEPLLTLDFDWSDYPDEPVPYDGTILHAMERLMPFVAQSAGYSCAVTHIFGKAW